MNKIDKYILKSFIGPFILTFFIALFVLLLQFLWKYVDDLVGKGLEWYIILKLLFYASANMVPLALPIAVLLASIMTYGNLGEHFELAAFKSAGISMVRFMRSTIIAVSFISIGAFLFENYVLPTAYLRFVVTLIDITKQKPALNIKPDEFYSEIDNYTILIGQKSPDNVSIRDVTIYQDADNQSNNNVLIAENGTMQTSPDKKNLVFTLYNGKQYEELRNDAHDEHTHAHIRMQFGEWEKTMDLSGFQMTHTSEDLYQHHYKMMTIGQLDNAMDSLDRQINRQKSTLAPALRANYYPLRDSTAVIPDHSTSMTAPFIDNIPSPLQKKVISVALQNARNNANFDEQLIQRLKVTENKIALHKIEWHRKFALAVACFVFLFIGAPLGAIIRKGGFGLPVICSILIFIFFFVINIIGEKMADENILTPFFGMWLSVLIIFPFSVFLTIKAKNDSPLVDNEWYNMQFAKVKKLFGGK